MKKFDRGINYYMLHENEVKNKIKEIPNFLLEESRDEKTHEYLTENKILPYGSHVLSLIDDSKIKWSSVHQDYYIRNSIVLNEVETIFKNFNGKVSTAVLFENFGTILSINACLACFSSGDVDFSASISEFPEIEKCMNEIGYVREARRGVPDSIMTTFVKQGVLPNKDFYVNFEWKPIARRYIRNMKKLHQRLEQFRTNNFKLLDNGIKVLSDDALLYFNLLHVSVGHYYNTSPGVRLYADIDRLIRHADKIDYQKIYSWAEEDNQTIRVFTALKLVKEILDTPTQDCSHFVSKNELSYSNKIIAYLWNGTQNTYANRISIIDQWRIDSLSEGMRLIPYALLRIAKLNKSSL